MRAIPALFAVLLLASAASADSVEWAIDPSHSHVGFSVAHMGVSSVTGRFKDVTGKVLLEEANLTKSTVDLTIKVDSIDTDDAKRDAHLKSAEFFDAATYPTMTFHATKIVKDAKGYKVTGDLKIRNISKPVTLDGTLSGPVKSPWGKEVRGAKFKGTIKRGDYGLKWNKALEFGKLLIGEEVELAVQLELNK